MMHRRAASICILVFVECEAPIASCPVTVPVNLRDPGLPVCIVLQGCMSMKARRAPQQSLQRHRHPQMSSSSSVKQKSSCKCASTKETSSAPLPNPS